MSDLGAAAVKPALVLVPTPIGNLGDMTPRAIEELESADSVACEDTRRTGTLFAHFGIAHDPFIVCNEHTEHDAAAEIVRRITSGQTVALVSDAGTPGVSDPGYRVTAAVIAAGLAVRSVPGASAALVGLTASGMISDRFCFDGFLPRKGAERSNRVSALVNEQRTTVLFEAPHRLVRTIDDLMEALGADRDIVLARELTKRFEEIWRGTLGQAAAHVGEVEPRGEYVLVLAGAPSTVTSEAQLLEALRGELDSGSSTRDAVSAVVEMTGAKKRQVYDLALRLTTEM